MNNLCGLVNLAGAPLAPGALQPIANATLCRVSRVARVVDRNVGFHQTTPVAGLEAGCLSLRLPAGSIHLVADARLDNRRELADQLADVLDFVAGQMGPDPALPAARLLLAAYLQWGIDCPARLEGDFALALWDGRNQQLLCACDLFSLKPLYWAKAGTLLCFASEIQQVLQSPATSRRVDWKRVAVYLVNHPEELGRTFFRDVRRLLPGHRLVATRGDCRLERYGDFEFRRTVFRDPGDYATAFLEILQRSVVNRTADQVSPIGIAMSGGLDSCSVAALAQQSQRAGGRAPLVAGSFVFDQLAEIDERSCILAMTKQWGLESILVPAERFWVLDEGANFSPSLGTPFMAWESCMRQMLSLFRWRGVQVFLTGHAGDDVVGGTSLAYRDRLRRGQVGVIGEVVRHARQHRQDLGRSLYRYFVEPSLSYRMERRLRRLLGRRERYQFPGWVSETFLAGAGLDLPGPVSIAPRRFAESSRQDLYEGVLSVSGNSQAVGWYDRHAAAFGLEARHPFLDRRLVEFVGSIPVENVVQLDSYKPLLRQALRHHLPDEVRQRPAKADLGRFLDFSLLDREPAQVQNVFQHPLAVELGILKGSDLRTAYRQYANHSDKAGYRLLWYALTTELWLRRHQSQLDLSAFPDECKPLSTRRKDRELSAW